jgi:hypothetical protein
MPSVAAIKAAVNKLPIADRADLLVDLAQDGAVRKEQLNRLRAAVAEGIRDHAEGRFSEIKSAAAHRTFFENIKRRTRSRLKSSA